MDIEKNIEIHSCASEKSLMSFPLGALCIKTAINSQSDLPKASVFENYLSDNPIAKAENVAERKPYAVGMSVYIWNYRWFEKFAKRIRELCPDIVLFAGGPQISVLKTCPDYLDFAVQGEGEISTIEAIRNGSTGIVKSVVPDLESLDSVFLSGNADSVLLGNDSVLWEFTRGCPFACAFCFESRGSKNVRDYPFARIEKELSYLIKKEVQNVFVLDPTFNLDKERAKKILRLLIENSPSYMHYTFEIRAELIDEESAELFASLNCSLQIGLQSADELVLKTIGRNFDRRVFENKVRLLAKRGVAFGLDVIIGLPYDTYEKFRDTINFAVSLMPSNIDVFLLSLLPGTELSSRQDEFGLIHRNDKDYTLQSSPTFPEEDVEKALQLKEAFDLFYTKGQACMWIHCLLEALNVTACNLFVLFDKWLKQTNRDRNEDIWLLQDDFVSSLFEKTQNTKLIPAIKSFMELHQGLCYVTDTQENAVLNLSYHPDDLANLDIMGLSEFVKTFKPKKCEIELCFDDNEGVVWKRIN